MSGDSKTGVGRQIHLPLKRAFLISLKSIKIRFWRSMITAAGIFLGIAFLVSVLTQFALQAPAVPTEQEYPNVFVRGMVANPIDKPMEPGLTVRMAINYAGGFAKRADQRSVSIVNNVGDTVQLDLSKAATPDQRLVGGDMVFVPDSSGRLRQLIVALVVILLVIVGLVFAKRIEIRWKRIGASTLVVFIGLVVFGVGLNRSGLTPPNAPRITVIKSYHIRGEAKTIPDVIAGKGVSLAQALRDAGGFTSAADRAHVTVIRRGGVKTIVDFRSTKNSTPGRDVILRAGDVVFVPDASARNRQIWLVIMSLIVCTIGITNSMLMSVTERFKEIGTMKCLGALDKFVVELFLLEAGLLGIAASFAGWAVGFGLMVLMAVASQGVGLLLQLSLADTLRMLGISLGAGCLLTTIATIAPAIRAAQMPPAAALRVEI